MREPSGAFAAIANFIVPNVTGVSESPGILRSGASESDQEQGQHHVDTSLTTPKYPAPDSLGVQCDCQLVANLAV